MIEGPCQGDCVTICCAGRHWHSYRRLKWYHIRAQSRFCKQLELETRSHHTVCWVIQMWVSVDGLGFAWQWL